MAAGCKRLASFFLLIKPNRLTNVLLLQAPWLSRLEYDARNIQREGKRPPKRTRITKKNSRRKKTQFAHKNCVEIKCFTLGQLNGTWEEVSTWINKVPSFLLWFINLGKFGAIPFFLCRGYCKKFEIFFYEITHEKGSQISKEIDFSRSHWWQWCCNFLWCLLQFYF